MTVRRYEVRVAGLVPNALLAGLADIELATQELRTVLSGQFPDQAALHGFLHRVRALGLDVVEVRQVAGAEPVAAGAAGAVDDAPDGDHDEDVTPRG